MYISHFTSHYFFTGSAKTATSSIMFSVYFLFNLLALLCFTNGQQQFGVPETDKITDDLFGDVGQAYVSSFEIVDTSAYLQVVLEVGYFQKKKYTQ